MRKSPGKWIKTLLFGKKSVKSRPSKGRASAGNAKDLCDAEECPALFVSSPVISQPIPVKADPIATKPLLESGIKADEPCDGHESFKNKKDYDIKPSVPKGSNNSEKSRKEEHAATKAQSAFRGFLARRAFRALKGIIRLQAVIRGHLVRRQAVATLKCTWGIVRLQTLARGRKLSQDVKQMKSFRRILSTLKSKDPINAFVRKILSFSTPAMPLKIQYHPRNPNSAWNWLEVWSLSKFWKSPALIRNSVDPKPTEPLRTRPKYSVRSFSGKKSPGPESELEKVKRSLRRISSAAGQMQSCGTANVENEKKEHDLDLVLGVNNLTMKVKSEDEDVKLLTDQEPLNNEPVQSPPAQDEDVKDDNGTLTSEERPSGRGSKRRASFPARPEQVDSGMRDNTPVLPSYMAATQSAKAKFSGYDSPRLGPDGAEKAAVTRRHSLPSGKPASLSSRTQRLVQPSCKAGVREKPVPVAWRR